MHGISPPSRARARAVPKLEPSPTGRPSDEAPAPTSHTSIPLSLGLLIQLRSVAAHCERVALLCRFWIRGRSVKKEEMRTRAIGLVTIKKKPHPIAPLLRTLYPQIGILCI